LKEAKKEIKGFEKEREAMRKWRHRHKTAPETEEWEELADMPKGSEKTAMENTIIARLGS
jgi:hypothetical protein